MEQKVFSTREAASYLGVTVKTIKEWDYNSILKPTFFTNGGHRRYTINDLNTFLANRNSAQTLGSLEKEIFECVSMFAKGLIELSEFITNKRTHFDCQDYPDIWKKASVLMLNLSIDHGLDDFEFPLTIPEQYCLCTVPLSKWSIDKFGKVFDSESSEALISNGEITDYCREIASQSEELYDIDLKPFKEIIEETRLYNEDDEYQKIRKFIIENPIIEKEDLDYILLTNFQGNSRKYRDRIKQIYEDIPIEYIENDYILKCPYCGWTLKRRLINTSFKNDESFKYKCNTQKCTMHSQKWVIKEKLYAQDFVRVKRGIQEYIVEPGIIEIRLFKEIQKLFLEKGIEQKNVLLYPECDFADIKLNYPNDTSWVIDVKDWKTAQTLALHLNNKTLFQSYRGTIFDKGIVVIPNTYGKDYIRKLKAYWNNSSKYEVLTYREVLNLIKQYLEEYYEGKGLHAL